MRKRVALVVATAAIALGSFGIGGADACPDQSKNPGDDPPSCGKQKAPPTTTVCPDGIVTGPANDLTEGQLVDILCPVHEGVEGATGIPV